jgi:mannobiose 2-epimerase
VTYRGEPLDTKKQIYALAFAVYGLSEYHLATGDEEARQLAIRVYRDIVTYSHDRQYGGYIEALARDWSPLGDIRLSEKDANERKSMNTHLHVLEGFANLYRAWPDAVLKERIEELIYLFLQNIISPATNHLDLFFNDEWQVRSTVVSYGHDIEAAWLIEEAALIIGEKSLADEVRKRMIPVAEAAAGGLDDDGGLWDEYDPGRNHWTREKHWWPQAEAMVGFFNTWQATGDERWLEHSLRSWNFVKEHILDQRGGEWIWGITSDGSPMTGEDKAGIWKCPYHNSRACIEIIRRIDALKYETA